MAIETRNRLGPRDPKQAENDDHNHTLIERRELTAIIAAKGTPEPAANNANAPGMDLLGVEVKNTNRIRDFQGPEGRNLPNQNDPNSVITESGAAAATKGAGLSEDESHSRGGLRNVFKLPEPTLREETVLAVVGKAAAEAIREAAAIIASSTLERKFRVPPAVAKMVAKRLASNAGDLALKLPGHFKRVLNAARGGSINGTNGNIGGERLARALNAIDQRGIGLN